MNEKNGLLRQVVSRSVSAPAMILKHITDYGISKSSPFWNDLADEIYDLHRRNVEGAELQAWLDAGLVTFLSDVFKPPRYVWPHPVLVKIGILAMESEPESWFPEPLRSVLLRVYLNNIDSYRYGPAELKGNRVFAAIANGSLDVGKLGVTTHRMVRQLVNDYCCYRRVDIECECGQDC